MLPRIPKDQVSPIAHRVNDTCATIGVGRTKLYALIAEGKIRVVRIGGRTLIPHSELERLSSEAL